MLQGLYSASTAINAYQKVQSVTANNIANVNTGGFQAGRTTLADLPTGGVRVNSVVTDDTPGYLMNTNRPLDIAIDGPGYFRVENDSGQDLTRSGSFRMDEEGNLVDPGGSVLAYDIGPADRVEIDNEGNIFADGDLKGQVEIVDRFGEPVDNRQYELRTGMLEASNVDMAREIVDSVITLGGYKSNITMAQSNDEMLGTIINMVG
ncbi:flagellar hook-basal body protein [Limisalsivibrio acetivorans]|uniref:flagellar hook-basal body protein n=1 Tax=Limisalsivibrio acetivorans TaxID=1304888 RepID=UPI0003B38914|nr:flagellar hook basal-body protein [Limisalsivibrio acetivorans]